jgi:hypothetical protein
MVAFFLIGFLVSAVFWIDVERAFTKKISNKRKK